MATINKTKQVDWDTDDHNYWLAKSCQIAKGITSNQNTNPINKSLQAIVKLQSEPNVATNQSKFNDETIITTATTTSINNCTEFYILPLSTGLPIDPNKNNPTNETNISSTKISQQAQ